MNKLLLLSIFFLITTTHVSGENNKTLRVGWRNWVPFAIGTDKTSKGATGLDVEIIKAVMKSSKCKFAFTKNEIPWRRQLLMLEDGSLDIVFGVSKKTDREKFGLYTDQYRSRYVGLFVRRGQVKKWKGISIAEDLLKFKFTVGVVNGYSYGKRVDSILKKMKPDSIVKPQQNRLKLIYRRLDGYLAYLPDESIFINDNDYDHRIQLHSMELVYTGGIHFLLSKKSVNKSTLNNLNKAITVIKSNGVYDKILKKYSTLYGIKKW